MIVGDQILPIENASGASLGKRSLVRLAHAARAARNEILNS